MKQSATSASVYLGELLVGHLTHYQDGRNVFVLNQEYVQQPEPKPTLSLAFNEPERVYTSMHALPSFFSNLLPEGFMRDLVQKRLSLRENNEFRLLMALREDLPGNIIIQPDEKYQHTDPKRDKGQLDTGKDGRGENAHLHFSLAGVQVKFSMSSHDHQFTLKAHGLGDTIVKMPSVLHPRLPENEYAMMELARAVGIDVPRVELIQLDALSGLPPMNLPDELYAFAIDRFDRKNGARIHIEDFAQAFGVRSREKYTATNYESIARLLNNVTPDSERELAELIRRLTFNILVANTDAHLKNFSLIYYDGVNPELAPAYDLITSLGYIDNQELALNFARHKRFYDIDQTVVQMFAKRSELDLDFVKTIIAETVKQASLEWPARIKALPIPESQLALLREHWAALAKPFSISGVL